MAKPTLFLTWVQSELPWLYDKKTDYENTANLYNLLTQVKNYYTYKCQELEAEAYNNVLHLNTIKNDQYDRFNGSYNNFNSTTSYENYDQLAKNGILSDPLNTYKLLSDKLSDFIMPIGG